MRKILNPIFIKSFFLNAIGLLKKNPIFILKYLSNRFSQVLFFKSPAISLMIREIDAFFPNVKYIHLYRNGYAVVQSIYKKEYFKAKRYQDVRSDMEFKKLAANYWVLSMHGIQAFLKTKEDVIEFSYEDFTRNSRCFLDLILQTFDVPGEIQFDYSLISSRNFKIQNLTSEEIKELSLIMSVTLSRNGYDIIK